MGVHYHLMCSCLCVMLNVKVGCKPVNPSVQQSSSSSSSFYTPNTRSSLPVPHEVDSIYSRVVASNTQDNLIDYQTYSGIKILPPFSGANQGQINKLSSKAFIFQPPSQNIAHKPETLLTLPTAQPSDLNSISRKVKSQSSIVQQRNFKNAEENLNALSQNSNMPNIDSRGQLQFMQDNTRGVKNPSFLPKTNEKNMDTSYREFSMADENTPVVQLAIRNSNAIETAPKNKFSSAVLTFATSVVALFSVVVLVGIFGCCCKKKERSDVNDNANKNSTELVEKNNSRPKSMVETVVINTSDIPVGEKDLDETTTVKDKIKAFDTGKLVIQPSPDPAVKRKSQNDLLHDNKRLSNIQSPGEEEVAMRDKTDQSKSKSIGDRISKSDTQDDVSDKIFDNISMEDSIISQPHNPDVVIADTDEEDEFSEIQRGTVILKSFQRAKPPRNRSPATRTSKGKIRKSRPGLNSPARGKSPGRVPSREPSHDRDQGSTPSSASVPVSQGISSKTNSLEKQLAMSASLTDSLEKRDREGVHSKADSMEKSVDSLMVKSSEFSDFDSVMSKSVTSIGSEVHVKNDSPLSARKKKLKESPKGDRSDRPYSPARSSKNQDKELTSDQDFRNESPNRYKKNKDSPHGRRKHRRVDKGNVVKKDDLLPTDISEGQEVKDTSVANRLSGLPPNVNNIFYLIDPTVKNKCKSVGDVTDDDNKHNNRKSGDYSKSPTKAQPQEKDQSTKQNEEPVSPVRRERTQSDPYRKSKLVEQTHM